MPTQKQGITLVTRCCFHTSTKALATLFGTCPKSTEKHKSPITPHLHQVSPPRQRSRDVHGIQELNVNKREIHLVEVKYCEETRPGHQLEASRKQHDVLCKCLKDKKIIFHTILLGVGGSIYTSHTLNRL